MPIDIIMSTGDFVPAVIANADEDGLLAELRKIVFAPALPDIEAAQDWLSSLAMPSGWFADADEARQKMDKWTRETYRKSS